MQERESRRKAVKALAGSLIELADAFTGVARELESLARQVEAPAWVYELRAPPQPSPEELESEVLRLTGFESVEELLAHVKSVGGGGAGSLGARGRRHTGGPDEAGGQV